MPITKLKRGSCGSRSARRDQDGLSTLQRVGDVGGQQAVQCCAAFEVPLHEEHAALFVRGDVADGNVAADALADDAQLAVGELVASELATRLVREHGRDLALVPMCSATSSSSCVSPVGVSCGSGRTSGCRL
jgi:hypothetical protein